MIEGSRPSDGFRLTQDSHVSWSSGVHRVSTLILGPKLCYPEGGDDLSACDDLSLPSGAPCAPSSGSDRVGLDCFTSKRRAEVRLTGRGSYKPRRLLKGSVDHFPRRASGQLSESKPDRREPSSPNPSGSFVVLRGPRPVPEEAGPPRGESDLSLIG